MAQRYRAHSSVSGPVPERLWEEALPRIRSQIGDRNFDIWIAPLEVAAGNATVALAAPTPEISASVNRHFVQLIGKVLADVSGRPVTVEVSVRPPEATPAPLTSVTSTKASRDATFDRFVVGESNQDAYAHALAVAEGRFRGPSPLVLYGGVGVGKTHLACAIGNAIRSDASPNAVVCEPCTDFVDRFFSAVEGGQPDRSLEQLSQATVLILDDVHFLAGHEATQEALLQVFSMLHERGIPVVLTSDRVPQEIPDLEQRLRERFEGGVLAHISAPEFDLRRRLLLRKAADRGDDLPRDVAAFLSERITGSCRALEGALTRVYAYAASQVAGASLPLRLTRALAGAALRVFETPRERITPELICAVVAEDSDLTVRALTSRRRTRDVTLARQLAMYLCRKYSRLPLTEIAHRLGRRDHTTVLHAREVIERRRQADPAFEARVNRLEDVIRLRAR